MISPQRYHTEYLDSLGVGIVVDSFFLCIGSEPAHSPVLLRWLAPYRTRKGFYCLLLDTVGSSLSANINVFLAQYIFGIIFVLCLTQNCMRDIIKC